jgi:protein-disulfide isomerase
MASAWIERGLRGCALMGLATSALLLAEHQRPVSGLCVAGGGCDAARRSALAELGGVPLPVFGLVFFAAVLALSLAARGQRLLVPMAAAGGLGGATLLGVQAFSLGALCPFCVLVDVAAMAVAALALVRHRYGSGPARSTKAWLIHGLVAAALCAGAVGLSELGARQLEASITHSLPPEIAREQKPGLVTIVEFLDFQCPACRAQHGQLKALLAAYRERIHMVYKHLPLPQHRHAEQAAHAHCCAEEAGAGAVMADELFAAKAVDTTDCEAIAARLGLDLAQFRACVASPHIRDRVVADRADASAVNVRGLPTYWIDEERFEGVHDGEVLRASLERALRRRDLR